jgi:hypothetical protein
MPKSADRRVFLKSTAAATVLGIGLVRSAQAEPPTAARRPQESLREELNAVPVVDAHEHVRSHEQCQAGGPAADVTSFIRQPYLYWLLPHADQNLADRIGDMTRPDKDRWADLRRAWPLVRTSGFAAVTVRMLRRWGIDDLLQDDAYDRIRDRLAARDPEASRRAYAQARIEKTLTDGAGHPVFGGMRKLPDFFAGRLVFEKGFYPLLNTTAMHDLKDRESVQALEHASGGSIGSVDALCKAVDDLVARSVECGIVALKDLSAYSRGIGFGPADKSGAEGELKRLLVGEKLAQGPRALSDYVFHHLVKLSIEHRIPVALHTGNPTDPEKTNARQFVPILKAYPQARFDLFHLNYPWMEDLLAVLMRYPNTYANCCWSHIVDPLYTTRFLQHAAVAIPANRIFGFGGDFVDLPEPVLAHLEIARDNIALALDALVRRNWCSWQTALELARMWLYDGPRIFYRV